MDQKGATFESWAVVELFGHSKEFGFVTTQYFGGECMFQVDVPALPERDVRLDSPQYVAGSWTPEGAIVRKSAVAGRTRLVGPGAIYSINPCTEDVVRRAIDDSSRAIAVVSIPDRKLLSEGHYDEDYGPEAA